MLKKRFKKILVANRGEIASRIIRAIKEWGSAAVAVYETPDAEARHVIQADEAVWLGDGPCFDYLNVEKMIAAAKRTGAEAIHPGYGFLAENPDFAKACREAGLVFIGPPTEVIKALGDKVIARKLMEEAGIPVVPGTDPLPSGEEGKEMALSFAKKYGFPLLIKAVGGGGGRGIRQVNNEEELLNQIPLAEAEAKSAFGDPRVYLEKYLPNPKHIEVQILGDEYGNVIHLGTRDCSIQRRHQKLVEIAPDMLNDEKLTSQICEAAIKAAKKVGYINAGTVEFLVKGKEFYFLEINTRLQVEHTVTEMITGVDIVRAQLEIAAGNPLPITQENVILRGHAIEMRINAEDPKNNFLPESGKKVLVYYSPGGFGVRLDGCAYPGYVVPQAYDSLLVKLTVYGLTWEEAVERLKRALNGFIIIGPKTTIPFYLQIVDDPDFRAGNFDTGYLETHPHLLNYKEEEQEVSKIARLIAEIHHRGFNPYAI
ncbi:MAG TPA: acetyl-CoA carboxylase biotin carboxylase subunit [Candidatus Desulfofervidus auxilii]|uniref:Acetyl-CoA carboxylase biotin carboxylase subunit n=1 Tax=Desulfofervidus auxilii TaxID=1621989 RepID=A0A7C0U340_DESA2|nr:acetyl-CoA carboxylase biotin carboxylase subunit [Candidatus Desulfofervidus auxilii]